MKCVTVINTTTKTILRKVLPLELHLHNAQLNMYKGLSANVRLFTQISVQTCNQI